MLGWKRQELLYLIYIPTSLILDLSSITLNGLISYVLKKHKRTRIVTFWFIYCLSISDVMVGITGLIYHSLQLDIFIDPENASWNSSHKWLSVCFGYSLLSSWILILVIAIDRCIHMIHPHRYSMIVTKSRARIILLLSIIFCILMRPPSMLASNTIISELRLARYIVYTAGTFGIVVIYLLLYFLLRRRVITLQTCEAGHAAVQDTPGNDTNFQNASSGSQLCYGCSRTKKCKKINAIENLHSRNLCMMFKERNDQKESQKENFQLPIYNAISPIDFTENNGEILCIEPNANCWIEKFKLQQQQVIDHQKITKKKNECNCKLLNIENGIQCVNMTSNTSPAALVGSHLTMQAHAIRQTNDVNDCHNEIGVADNTLAYLTKAKACNERMIDTKAPNGKPTAEVSVNKVSRKRFNTPDEEVKKVICLILLALSISYVPSMINYFHLHATGNELAAISFIAHISILFNSSLNAIILIVCSKDIQRKVKAVFRQC